MASLIGSFFEDHANTDRGDLIGRQFGGEMESLGMSMFHEMS